MFRKIGLSIILIGVLVALVTIFPALISLFSHARLDSEGGVMFAAFFIFKWILILTPVFLCGIGLWSVGIFKKDDIHKAELILNKISILLGVVWLMVLLIMIIE